MRAKNKPQKVLEKFECFRDWETDLHVLQAFYKYLKTLKEGNKNGC